MAAAIGAGLPVEETRASMVVDIGGGTTDVAVISLGGIVTSRSVRIGGDEIDEAIIAHVKCEYSLLLGERSAEDIKVAAGSAFPLVEELTARVRGRDLVTGLPKTVTISSAEVRRAIETPVMQIVELVRATLDVCPPELAGDIVDRGIAAHRRGSAAARPRRAAAPRARRPGARRRRPPARRRPRGRPVRRGVRHPRAGARRQPPPLTCTSAAPPPSDPPGRPSAGAAPGCSAPVLGATALVVAPRRPAGSPTCRSCAPPRRRSSARSSACSVPMTTPSPPSARPAPPPRSAPPWPARRPPVGPSWASSSPTRTSPGSASSRPGSSPSGRRAPAGPERVTIDVGSRDGVETDLTVVAADGLVGRVVAVAPWTSDVLLVGRPGPRRRGAGRGARRPRRGVGDRGHRCARDRAGLLVLRLVERGAVAAGDAVTTLGSVGARVPTCPGSASARSARSTTAPDASRPPAPSPPPSTRPASTSSPSCSPRPAPTPRPARDGERLVTPAAAAGPGRPRARRRAARRDPRRRAASRPCPTSSSSSSSPGRCCAGRCVGAAAGLAAGWLVDLVPPGPTHLGVTALLYAAAGCRRGPLAGRGPVAAPRVAVVALGAAVLVEVVAVVGALAVSAPVDLAEVGLRCLLTATVAAFVVPLVVGAERGLVRRRFG